MTRDSRQDPSVSDSRLGTSDEAIVDVLNRLSKRRGDSQRYEVKREIARGGMGVILDIWDADLGRALAMKVVLTRSGAEEQAPAGPAAMDPRLVDRFLEEAQVTGQLDHPGIVPVHEIGIDETGRLYFTMRLVTGRDLEHIVTLVQGEQEGWTRTRAVGVMLKVCEAMAYAHDKGVVHRDLKPANIMVGRFGEVYVMDWGLARVLGRKEKRDVRPEPAAPPHTPWIETHRLHQRADESASALKTMDGDVIGTPAYMSPEQARGDLQTLGPATDIYAVGAILYHLLAGHSPYIPTGAKLNALDVWRLVRDGPPTPLETEAPDAPGELIAICEKAMARDITQRYAAMKDLAEDLRAYLEGRVVGAFEKGAFAVARKWILRNKALAGTLFAAVLVVLSGLVVHAFVLSKKNEELVQANASSRANEERAIANEVRAVANQERAVANEKVAREQEAIARDRADRILRLSDIRRLEELNKEADALWPADPDHIASLEHWLKDARELAGRRAGHEQALVEIESRAVPSSPSARSSGTTGFASAEDRWQHATQQALVVGLREFSDAAHGRIADVEGRLEFARTVEERSTKGSSVRDLWDRAIESIADTQTCPAYAGLRITPQLGIVPIGRDPDSRLWEFAHLQTGTIPTRDPSTGKLQLTAENGIVFVLVPGGTFEMGAQGEDLAGSNFDPSARPDESPPHPVTLATFLLSKYELTQGQWLRFAGSNPSIYGQQNAVFPSGEPTFLHPVEQVTWTECSEFLAKLGLMLPTEAQWEYCTRAGTTTPWWTGDVKESLEGAANLADQALARLGGTMTSIQDWPELDDGHGVHAPVDAFQPNPFGFHNMPGNVWEWCRDGYAPYGTDVQAGDGENLAPAPIHRVSRGGGFVQEATFARSSRRNNSPPETRANHLGVRPARELTK